MSTGTLSGGRPLKGERSKWKRQLWLTVGLVAIVLLAAAVFTLGSLRIPVHPDEGNGLVIWFALTVFMFAALLVFTLIMSRSLVRVWNERRVRQIGSRFKAKMVLGAMGVSLLPVVFLFFSSYALLNRTLNLWFPRPLEIANEQSRKLQNDMRKISVNYLNSIAAQAAKSENQNQLSQRTSLAADASWIVDSRDS